MTSSPTTLLDKFGRPINYLRLSVTDRCNLRCTYCMPERGMTFAHKNELLTFEEIVHLIDILGEMGVNKVRITGGEPFVRTDLIHLLSDLSSKRFLQSIGITSNLTVIDPYIQQLKALGITRVNVSLDALEAERFKKITRRDEFQQVYQNLMLLINEGFEVKINCVVMKGQNDDQIIPLLELARDNRVSVRFLEEMPFNGTGQQSETLTYKEILDLIGRQYAFTKQIDLPHATAQSYSIDGFKGDFGVIPSFSRTFCGDCNRLRLSATGQVRTCLYGRDQLNLRDMLRVGVSDEDIKDALRIAVSQKPKDGFAAADENNGQYESMTKLGG